MPSKLIAYRLSDRSRDTAKDIDTLDAARNFSPNGVTADASTFWVGDTESWQAFAYDRNNVSFPLHADNSTPRGVWATSGPSPTATMYVIDAGTTKKVFAYGYLSTTRDTTKEFNLHADNANPSGMWGDDVHLYIVDSVDDRVYVYQLSDGVRQTALEWTTTDATDPRGIWGDNRHFYITDRSSRTIRAYNAVTKARDASRDFDLSIPTNISPTGLYGDGRGVWICADDDKVYTYDFENKVRIPTRTLETLNGQGNTEPEDCYVKGNSIFVSDRLDNRLYLYTLFGAPEFDWEQITS